MFNIQNQIVNKMKKIGFLIVIAVAMMACEKAEDFPTVVQGDASQKTEIVKSESESETDGMSKSADSDAVAPTTPGFIKPDVENKGDQ